MCATSAAIQSVRSGRHSMMGLRHRPNCERPSFRLDWTENSIPPPCVWVNGIPPRVTPVNPYPSCGSDTWFGMHAPFQQPSLVRGSRSSRVVAASKYVNNPMFGPCLLQFQISVEQCNDIINVYMRVCVYVCTTYITHLEAQAQKKSNTNVHSFKSEMSVRTMLLLAGGHAVA